MADYEWFDGDPAVKNFVARALSELTPGEIGASDATPAINPQAAAYTLALSDQDGIVTVTDASANALTVPPNSAVAFPIGASVLIAQLGSGLTTITAGAGVTVHSPTTLKALGQYAVVKVTKIATNTWLATGQLALS